MFNQATIIGRLGKDPELKTTNSNDTIATLSVATDESYVSKTQGKVSKTEWHNIEVWGKMAENCLKYLNKGSLVCIIGSINTQKWQDKNGQDRYTTKIKAQQVKFLGKNDNSSQGNNSNYPQEDNNFYPQEAPIDDMPF